MSQPMSQGQKSFVYFVFSSVNIRTFRFSFIACSILLINVVNGFCEMCLRGTHEGISMPISVPSGHREISVCKQGLKLDNFNSITSLQRIDFMRLNGAP